MGLSSFMNYEADVRSWYVWCADLGFPHFDSEAAFELGRLTIGGNSKGLAVLSRDPNAGPIEETDFGNLTQALRDLDKSEKPRQLLERCLVWLVIATGANPKNLALLKEGDLTSHRDRETGEKVYVLNIPRIKKRGAKVRTQFKPRRLHTFLGSMLEDLIAENGRRDRGFSSSENEKCRPSRPLFRRKTPNRWANTDAAEYAWHFESNELSQICTAAVDALELHVHGKSGLRFRATPRRFRYTYASRLVREGASPQQVAEALDHSDLQHVMVYFDVRSDIVPYLDRADSTFASIASYFLGRVVDGEGDAERGCDPDSRIYAPAFTRTAEPIGSCGTLEACGLYASIACYRCKFIRPWRDGPHQLVLDALIAERGRKIQSKADPKNIQIFDETIAVVAHVVAICSPPLEGEEAGNV